MPSSPPGAATKAAGLPRKADQDRLDAALCLLIALRWRLRPRDQSVLLGDLASGYIVAPSDAPAVARIASTAVAGRFGVPIDGVQCA